MTATNGTGDWSHLPLGVPVEHFARVRDVFRCAECGDARYVMRDQAYRADGLMVCRDCRGQAGGYWKCSRCERILPGSTPRVRDGNTVGGVHSWCQDCDRPRYVRVPVTDHICERCGGTFPAKRKDAKFCSVTCRVTAHRERTAVDG